MFVKITDNRYEKLATRFCGAKGAAELADYASFLFNAVIRYKETGDPTHLNRTALAAVNVGRVRMTKALVRGFSAHDWDKDNGFNGKADKVKLAKLRKLTDDDIASTFAERWESLNSTEAKEAQEFDLDKYIKLVVSRIMKNHVDATEFKAKLDAAIAAKEAA